MAGAGGFVIVTFCDTVVVHCDDVCHLARVIVPVPTVFHFTYTVEPLSGPATAPVTSEIIPLVAVHLYENVPAVGSV
jgi:hypothetical protein